VASNSRVVKGLSIELACGGKIGRVKVNAEDSQESRPRVLIIGTHCAAKKQCKDRRGEPIQRCSSRFR
jgi:hypothetical protein